MSRVERIGDCTLYLGDSREGVSCAGLGRKFVGVELDQQHFDTACRRIEEAQFAPKRKVIKPGNFFKVLQRKREVNDG